MIASRSLYSASPVKDNGFFLRILTVMLPSAGQEEEEKAGR
jgi:hypothetical protein